MFSVRSCCHLDVGETGCSLRHGEHLAGVASWARKNVSGGAHSSHPHLDVDHVFVTDAVRAGAAQIQSLWHEVGSVEGGAGLDVVFLSESRFQLALLQSMRAHVAHLDGRVGLVVCATEALSRADSVVLDVDLLHGRHDVEALRRRVTAGA